MLRVGAPVVLEIPLTVAGEDEVLTVTVRPPDRAFLRGLAGLDAEAAEAYFTPERIAGQLVAWEGLGDADGNPLPVTPEAVALLREAAPTVFGALVEGLFAAAARKSEERRGN